MISLRSPPQDSMGFSVWQMVRAYLVFYSFSGLVSFDLKLTNSSTERSCNTMLNSCNRVTCFDPNLLWPKDEMQKLQLGQWRIGWFCWFAAAHNAGHQGGHEDVDCCPPPEWPKQAGGEESMNGTNGGWRCSSKGDLVSTAKNYKLPTSTRWCWIILERRSAQRPSEGVTLNDLLKKQWAMKGYCVDCAEQRPLLPGRGTAAHSPPSSARQPILQFMWCLWTEAQFCLIDDHS